MIRLCLAALEQVLGVYCLTLGRLKPALQEPSCYASTCMHLYEWVSHAPSTRLDNSQRPTTLTRLPHTMTNRRRPRKRFGQHFLHDPGVIARIVTSMHMQASDTVVEIGPGQGALTTALLAQVERLQVIELDRDLIPALQRDCAALGELTVHAADALSFDYRQLAPAPAGLRVCGNLPYNISTPLLFHLLAQAEVIADMHFLLQKEVVQRLAAAPGGGDYGRLSVMVQYHCQVEQLFKVSAGAFWPVPQVESAVVRLRPHRPLPHPVQDYELFADLVRQAFGQRRKTLRNALKGWANEAALEATGIAPDTRAERVTVAAFVALANHLSRPAQL